MPSIKIFPDVAFKRNKIIFIVQDRLKWLMSYVFCYDNLHIISDEHIERDMLPFDYHCNLISLIKYLNYDYHSIPFVPLFQDINVSPTKRCSDIMETMVHKNTFILNWKGNSNNHHEKHNRMMPLHYAIPLFQIQTIQWFVITQHITKEEKDILDQYNVNYVGNNIDKEHAFEDTIHLIRCAKGVLSTDTSILHVSSNLNIPTYALLTKGCDWRWGTNTHTNWYPNITLCKQPKYNDWESVIEMVKTKIT